MRPEPSSETSAVAASTLPLCVQRFGPGPVGATCADCTNAFGFPYGGEAIWFCKQMRDCQVTAGETIQDRVSPEQQACGNFEPREAKQDVPWDRLVDRRLVERRSRDRRER